MADQDADRTAIIELINRNRIAIWTHDFDLWETCFVHAPYTTRWGWWQSGGIFVRRGWEEIRERARQGAPERREKFAYDTKVLNLSLQIGVDMAWATYDQQYPRPDTQTEGGTGLTREARVFEKHDGEWKIAFLGLLIGAAGGANVIRLNPDGSIQWASDGAKAALELDDNLVIRNGALRFRERRLDRQLADAIKWAGVQDDGFYMSEHGALPILAEQGEGLPTRIYWVIADAGMILFSFGEQRANERRLDIAARLYGLSPAQRSLAGLVAEGLTLAEIAARMGITANTARTHLNRVFDKTGVRTQPALVRVLLSAIAPI